MSPSMGHHPTWDSDNAFSTWNSCCKQNFFSSLLDNESPSKRFWGYCKSRSGQSSIPDSIIHNSIAANTPADIANTFSCFFSECFNRADGSSVPIPQYDVTSHLSFLQCSSDEIQSLICKLQTNSAAGIDGITSMMLKHTASSISPILCSLFNLSLSTGRIPDAWKLSRVVPVFKAGDPHEVSNYRPISLQPINICGKLLIGQRNKINKYCIVFLSYPLFIFQYSATSL